MRQSLRTWYAVSLSFGLTGVLSPVVAALAMRDERGPDRVLRFWARSLLGAAGVRLHAEGLEHLPTDTPFVLAVNHQSHFDPLVLLAHLSCHLRWVAKASLFEIPLFGMAMRSVGTISVSRKGNRADRERMNDALKAVREQVSIVFFVEGTRSKDGRLLPFKKGATVLALEGQVPLVPAALAGTGDVLPSGTLRIRPGRSTALVVGAPISTIGLTVEDRDALTARAREEVARLLERGNELIRG